MGSLDLGLQLLGSVEGDDPTRRDGDLLARLGVATRALLLVAQLEVAEPRELDAFTADQRGADFLEEGWRKLRRADPRRFRR